MNGPNEGKEERDRRGRKKAEEWELRETQPCLGEQRFTVLHSVRSDRGLSKWGEVRTRSVFRLESRT